MVVCTYGFVTSGCVYYGFDNVCLCVCMGFVLPVFLYVWDMYCAVVCMYGFFNVWVCVCMGFVRSGCVYVWDL